MRWTDDISSNTNFTAKRRSDSGIHHFFCSPDFFQQPFEILIPNLIYAFSKGRESSSLNFITNGSFCSLICFNSSKNNTDLLLIGHVGLNLKFDINIFIEEIAFENVCENSTIVSQLQRETSSGD